MTVKLNTILSILLFGIGCCNAAQASTEKLISAIQKGKTLQGYFVQNIYDDTGAYYKPVDGMFYIKRPHKFLWYYSGDGGQKIVSTGSRVYVEQPDLKQVTHASLEQAIKSSPIVILLAPDRIDEFFIVSDQPSKEGIDWVMLTPKNTDDSTYESIQVGLKLGGIKHIKVLDSLDRIMWIKFLSVQYNKPIKDDMFNYKMPNYNSDR